MHGTYKDLQRIPVGRSSRKGKCLASTSRFAWNPSMAAAACALTEIGENSPAIHFDNIAGFSDAPVAMNVHGSWYEPHFRVWHGKRRRHAQSVTSHLSASFQLYPGALEDSRERALARGRHREGREPV